MGSPEEKPNNPHRAFPREQDCTVKPEEDPEEDHVAFPLCDLHSFTPAIDGFGLMTFEEAAGFLHSGVSVSTLRKARRDGRLWATKIGNRFYTHKQALGDYLQCQGTDNRPASTLEATNVNGLSATATLRSGQDVALNSVAKLKRLSQATSQTNRLNGGKAVPIRGS